MGEDNVGAPAQDTEFVLSHGDNIQATGFLEHIKLPHYVDFQSELELIRKLRREAAAQQSARDADADTAADARAAGTGADRFTAAEAPEGALTEGALP